MLRHYPETVNICVKLAKPFDLLFESQHTVAKITCRRKRSKKFQNCSGDKVVAHQYISPYFTLTFSHRSIYLSIFWANFVKR